MAVPVYTVARFTQGLYWQSLYAGGKGVKLSPNIGSVSSLIPGYQTNDLVQITNTGVNPAFILFGSSSGGAVTADDSCVPLQPGAAMFVPFGSLGGLSGTVDTVAAYCAAATTVVVSVGLGNKQ